jgi:23S rRNA (cytosine1962-C5)-methyltransferase
VFNNNQEIPVNPDYPKVSIKKGREWHIVRGHPWLFSGGISQAPTKIAQGSLVTLVDCDGKYIATGYFNGNCDIAVRVLSRKPSEEINEAFLQSKIRSAWELRRQALDFKRSDVFRLLNAEGDFLPGFIVDYYAGVAVVQCHTAGADALLDIFLSALDRVVSPRTIIVRNDASVRHREGLQNQEPRIASGSLSGDLIVRENGFSFAVNPVSGQKTGFFTDQRDKRAALAGYAARLPAGATFLNCFSYTCSFSIYALAANSELMTTNVDQSAPALEQGRKNYELNSMPAEKHLFINADAFSFLEKQIAHGETYDIAVLDPPAFAKSHKEKAKALKAYARMAALGLSSVKDGGILALCSCSGAVSLDEFIDSIRQSAGQSGSGLQVLDIFQHGADHPVNFMAPETSYLKVVFCRVLK